MRLYVFISTKLKRYGLMTEHCKQIVLCCQRRVRILIPGVLFANFQMFSGYYVTSKISKSNFRNISFLAFSPSFFFRDCVYRFLYKLFTFLKKIFFYISPGFYGRFKFLYIFFKKKNCFMIFLFGRKNKFLR